MTVRLIGLARANWRVLDGYAVGHNIGPLDELPLERLANFIYWFFTRNGEEKDKRKFDADLWRPDPKDIGKEIDARSPWSAENEMKAFASFKGQLQPS